VTYANDRTMATGITRQAPRPRVEVVREARRAVVHEYRFGGPPARVSEAAREYLAGDGLLRALTDLESALDELLWEHRRTWPLFRLLTAFVCMLVGQVSPLGKGIM